MLITTTYYGYHFLIHNLIIQLTDGSDAILIKQNEMKLGQCH
jgi:hypothetical protein